MKLEIGYLSDIGQKRDHNEDYLGMYRPSEAEQRRAKGELFLVADGVGGHQAGEIASRVAVERAIQAYGNSPGRDPLAELTSAVARANTAVYTLGQDQGGRRRMGTTLVGALVRGRDLHVVNVGDSRAYLVRKGHAEQISEDHSLVAEQVRIGLVDAERVKELGNRSAITRALGSKPKVKVDTFTCALEASDTIVLCTDGLSGMVGDGEIARIVSDQPPAQAVVSLVGLANVRGGKDNITAIVIKAHQERRNLRPLACLLGVPVLILVMLLALVPFTLGLGQELPRRAPVVAPIEPAGDQGSDKREEFAHILGYQDVNDVLIKLGLLPAVPWPPLKPWITHVLLTGRIVRLESPQDALGRDQPCSFTLEMGEQIYSVVCPPEAMPSQEIRLARHKQVSVLGTLMDSSRRVRPIAIDVNEIKWLGLNSEWKNWYTTLKPERPLLVYTVTSPYTISLESYGIHSGEAVAVYGLWGTVTGKGGQNIGLVSLGEIFKLEGDIYKQVALE